MSRTVELGRAVVSSPSTKHELWLTTLITISPATDATDLQHLTDDGLIEVLASGNVWVGRAHGMHLTLDIALHRHPLPDDRLRQLADNIVNAPAWEQLGLQPSLPVGSNYWHGKLQVNISQRCGELSTSDGKPRDKYAKATLEHVTPPEGVPVLWLHSVESTVVVLETRDRTGSTSLKRPKARPNRVSESPEDEILFENAKLEETAGHLMPNSEALFEDISMLPFAVDPETPCSKSSVGVFSGDSDVIFREGDISEQPPVTPLKSRKRHRPSAVPSSPRKTCSSASSILIAKRPQLSPTTTISETPFTSTNEAELGPIEMMIDASMRIAVCNSLRGSHGGLRIKASTFNESLADIAPALWRPGGLSMLSPRVKFSPTLNTSLGRVSSRANSGSMRNKIVALSGSASQTVDNQVCTNATNTFDVSRFSTLVAARIWILVQKKTIAKPLPCALQSFCVPKAEHVSHVDVSEILEAEWGQSKETTTTFDPALGLLNNLSNQYERGVGDEKLVTKSGRADGGIPDDDEPLFGCI